MPRKPRFYLPGIPAHVVQRGNDRRAVFFRSADYQTYLHLLAEGARAHGCAIHAYVLMTNHVHLLVTPQDKDAIGRMVQYVGRRYVPYVNRTYGKSGTLWEGRHKGCPVSSDGYLLACMRYIELNPVRAGLVASPDAYPWSSYPDNAAGRSRGLVVPHPTYRDLGVDEKARGRAYRGLFQAPLKPSQLRELRTSAQTGTPLGNARFRAQIEQTLERGVGQARRGRPSRA